MNNKTKKPVHEKIILLILYLIGSPFIIGGLLLFIIIYLVIFMFEIPFYITSNYYKDIRERYYTFIIFSKSYRTYNKLRKGTTKTINKNLLAFQNDEIIITLLLEKDIIINQELLDNINVNDKINHFVINIKNISKEDLKILKSNYSLITFKD